MKMWVTFSDRLQIERMYYEWASENKVKDCPSSLVAFLQSMGWINEDKVVEYFSSITEGSDDEESE